MTNSCSINRYQVDNEYVTCVYYEIKNVLYVEVIFKSVEGVSAIHIHSAQSPNPVLVWLLTSQEWQNGVAQTTFKSNFPCCSNLQCNVVAPTDIPFTNNVILFQPYQFIVSPPLDCLNMENCPWTSQGTILNIHGKQFQYFDRCRLSDGMPGIDLLSSTPFQQIPCN